MNHDATHDVLNRLLSLHTRSLPMYLHYAAPWTNRDREQEREVLMHVAADQQALAERIGSLILDEHGDVNDGEFPLEFTGYNDLSFDFLLRKLIEHQQRDIAQIDDCVRRLEDDPRARALAEEALGAAKGHLDSLEELAAAAVRREG